MNESGLNIEELLVWDRNQFQVCRMIGRRETRKPHPLAHTHTNRERQTRNKHETRGGGKQQDRRGK